MKRMVIMIVLLTGTMIGCSNAAGLPSEVVFDGARLERGTTWSRGKVSGVVFTGPGEKLPSASLRVGIIVSGEHKSSSALHHYVRDLASLAAGDESYYETSTSDEACKVGVAQWPPRPFVALQMCRSGERGTACVESDEKIGEDVLGSCLHDARCWSTFCANRWTRHRAPLEALANSVASGQ